MQQLPLNQRVDRVGQHVVRARLFLDLWSYFEEADTRPHIIGVMQEYNEFFRFTPHAYFATHVIYISGVFDKTKGTISLWPLTHQAKSARILKEADAVLAETLLTEAKPIADKVTILRHNAFAHRSAHISYDDAFERASVTPNELRKLTDLALKIANLLLLGCELQPQYFAKLPREAAIAMMRALGAKQ